MRQTLLILLYLRSLFLIPTTIKCVFYLLSSTFCFSLGFVFFFSTAPVSPTAYECNTISCCAPLFIFRAVTWRRTPPTCGSSEEGRLGIGLLLLLLQLVTRRWEKEGGTIKPFTTSRVLHSGGGKRDWRVWSTEEEGIPHPLNAHVFANNRRPFTSTEPSWLSLKTNFPLPR